MGWFYSLILQVFVSLILFKKYVLIWGTIVSEISCIWLCFSGVCKRQSHWMLPLKLQKRLFCWKFFFFNKKVILGFMGIVSATMFIDTKACAFGVLWKCCLWVWNPKMRTRAFNLRGNSTFYTLVTCSLIFFFIFFFSPLQER